MLVEPTPKYEHGIEHLVRVMHESVLIDVVRSENARQLLGRVPCVVGFEPRVPGKKARVQRLSRAALPIVPPALDELVPETGGGPILDSP